MVRPLIARTDETEVIRAARLGDPAAFEVLVRRYQTRIYRLALRMLGEPARAEDAAQDVFLQAWKSLPSFRAESALSTWLYRIAVNRCLNVIRLTRSSEPLDESIEAPATRPNHILEIADELERLKVAIARLSLEQRGALVLRELEGLSYAEIADVLGTTSPAVKGRIHRARLELFELLREKR